MSFASERRLGLPRTSDLSHFQTTTTTSRRRTPPTAPPRHGGAAASHANNNNNNDEDDSDGYYYDDSEEDEEDRRLSARHGEAHEVGGGDTKTKKRAAALTDAEIAAEYNDSKKVPASSSTHPKPRKQRKIMMDEQDLIKPNGLSSILMNFPRQFEHNVYKKNRKDMAKFSLHLITAYQQWANQIVPGTPLEDVLWKIQSMNSKTSVKLFLQTMRNEVRNKHLERIYGPEKAQYFLSQLDDSYGETELQGPVSDGALGEAEGAPPPAPTDEPVENTDTNASVIPLPSTDAEIPNANGQENAMDEDDYLDMNDMMPVEEEDYADFDMHDTVSVVTPKPTQSKTGVDPETVLNLNTNPVPPKDFKNNHRRFIDHFESSDDEKDDVRGVVPSKTPRRSILVDSDDDDDDEEVMPEMLETRGSDKVNSVERDPIVDEDEASEANGTTSGYINATSAIETAF